MTATAVRERPILFSGPMVRAILEGRKTQTRRVVKLPRWSTGDPADIEAWGDSTLVTICEATGCQSEIPCPYGQPGDRLWVRETWRFLGTDMMRHGRTHSTQDGVVRYPADGAQRIINTHWENVERWMTRGVRTRPSIHMPRWASRIELEVTEVRVQRLQEISGDDAQAEGFYALADFAALWDKINGARGYGWETNPWVWAVTFRRVEG